MGVGVYFEWNARAQTDPYEDGRAAATGAAPNAHLEAPRELGSSDLPLLSQPLSQWKNPVNYIPAVPSECVRTAEKSYLDRPYSTHWEDELLLQASQAFSNQQEEEEDSLLLAASQDYEKRCGPLMTSDDVQSAVTAQVPLNTKRNNNWAANTWQAWAIGRNKSPHCHKSLRLINNLSTCGQVNMIFIDPTTSKETPTHSCVNSLIKLVPSKLYNSLHAKDPSNNDTGEYSSFPSNPTIVIWIR